MNIDYLKLKREKIKINYIYFLKLDEEIIYVGRTYRPEKRYIEHFEKTYEVKYGYIPTQLYNYIKNEVKLTEFFNRVKLEVIYEINNDDYDTLIKESSKLEKFYIEKCIKNGINILNNCCMTRKLKGLKTQSELTKEKNIKNKKKLNKN